MRGEGEAARIRELAVQGKRDIGIDSGVRPNGRGDPIGQATFVGSSLLCRVVDLRRTIRAVDSRRGVDLGIRYVYGRHEKKLVQVCIGFLYSSLIEPQAGTNDKLWLGGTDGWIDRHKGTMWL